MEVAAPVADEGVPALGLGAGQDVLLGHGDAEGKVGRGAAIGAVGLAHEGRAGLAIGDHDAAGRIDLETGAVAVGLEHHVAAGVRREVDDDALHDVGEEFGRAFRVAGADGQVVDHVVLYRCGAAGPATRDGGHALGLQLAFCCSTIGVTPRPGDLRVLGRGLNLQDRHDAELIWTRPRATSPLRPAPAPDRNRTD